MELRALLKCLGLVSTTSFGTPYTTMTIMMTDNDDDDSRKLEILSETFFQHS